MQRAMAWFYLAIPEDRLEDSAALNGLDEPSTLTWFKKEGENEVSVSTAACETLYRFGAYADDLIGLDALKSLGIVPAVVADKFEVQGFSGELLAAIGPLADAIIVIERQKAITGEWEVYAGGDRPRKATTVH